MSSAEWRTDSENMPRSKRVKVKRKDKKGKIQEVIENRFIYCLTVSKCNQFIVTRYLPKRYNGSSQDGGYWEFYSTQKPIEEQVVKWLEIPSVN